MGSGWQVVLADLSMILFMVTAAAVADAPPDAPPPATASAAKPAIPALAAPVALWQGGEGAPPLASWLKAQPADPRLRLTIVAPVAGAEAALAMARGAGRPARIVLETDLSGPPIAALTYDQAETPVQAEQSAQPLQSSPPSRPTKEHRR